MITAYILIQAEPGKAATVAAALRDVPGIVEAASVAGPYDVIARAQAPDIDELARLAASQVQDLDGVTRTMTCPVVHLQEHRSPWTTTSDKRRFGNCKRGPGSRSRQRSGSRLVCRAAPGAINRKRD